MIANGDVGVDEFGIDVAQVGEHLRETMLEVEEHRAAANERLKVTGDFRGEKFVELREELRFAADPFEKRLRLID